MRRFPKDINRRLLIDYYLSIKLSRNRQPSIEFITNSPQQMNSYDCGVYVLLSINFLVKNLANLEISSQKGDGKVWADLLGAMKVEVTEATAAEYRANIHSEIRSINLHKMVT